MGGVCGGVAVLTALLLLWCWVSPGCPLARWRRRKRQASAASLSASRPEYRPVAASEPEPSGLLIGLPKPSSPYSEGFFHPRQSPQRKQKPDLHPIGTNCGEAM